ncbi:hypothetical protein [Flammeovirga sp. SJP92]|uniref:hypothetical protein n=1 Tax=Flammeovirga sp. SJP92 TaxID=1775430 RepID=UPI0007882383|nr:hypothetical protein [Flammeovirga sp. SJP92]KXX68892.1 hypothetical protein AVL50_17175 [Flammeovirga sp. SJP92]
MSISKLNERKILERARYTFNGVLNTPQLKHLLKLNGYSIAKVEKGQLMISETEELYKQLGQVREELKRLEELTKVRRCQLFNYFNIHRQSLIQLYHNDQLETTALRLDKEMPTATHDRMKEVEVMYKTIIKNIFIKDRVKEINIDENALDQIQRIIDDIKEKQERIIGLNTNGQTIFVLITEKQEVLSRQIEEIALFTQ